MKVDDRAVARAMAGGRIAIGAGFLAAPGLALKGWPGGDDERPITRSLARSLGGRDLALGLGLLLAVNHDSGQGPRGTLSGNVRGWLEAGMLADSADAVAIALAWRHLPRGRALVVLGGALAAVVAARRLVGALG